MDATDLANELGKCVTHFFQEALQKLEQSLKDLQTKGCDGDVLEGVPAAELCNRRKVQRQLLHDRGNLVESARSALDKYSRALTDFEPLTEQWPSAAFERLAEFRKRLAQEEACSTALQEQVSSVTAAQLEAWGINLSVGDPKTPSEQLAKEHLERGQVSVDTIFEVLEQCELPGCKSHQRPGLQDGARSMTLGMSQFGHFDPTVTAQTRKNRYLLRLLAAFLRLDGEHPCTSVAVSDAKTEEHVDDNLGTTRVLSIGNFTGGRLFVEENGLVDYDRASAEDAPHVHYVRHKVPMSKGSGRPIEVGQGVGGQLLMTHNKLREFDAGCMHFTEAFHGKRYTVSFFICRGAMQEDARMRFSQELSAAGLVYPSDDLVKDLVAGKTSNRTYKDASYVEKKPSMRMRAKGKASSPEDTEPGEPQREPYKDKVRKKVVELFRIKSNASESTEELREETEKVRKAVQRLQNASLKGRIEQLLTVMLVPPARCSDFGQGTFLSKTSGTYRVFLLVVLELLHMPQEEMAELRQQHRLTKDRISQGDVKTAQKIVEKIKRSWKPGAADSKRVKSQDVAGLKRVKCES